MNDDKSPRACTGQPTPRPTLAQSSRHVWLTMLAVVITTMPILLLGSVLWIICYQLHIAHGTRLIDAQWRRVGSSAVLQAQTLGQCLKLTAISLAWPIALPMIRSRIDRHLAGVPLSEDAPSAS